MNALPRSWLLAASVGFAWPTSALQQDVKGLRNSLGSGIRHESVIVFGRSLDRSGQTICPIDVTGTLG